MTQRDGDWRAVSSSATSATSAHQENLVQQAKSLAYRAHARQADKAGRPYIEHVARVAEAVAGDPTAEAVAWLHDALEDAPDIAEEFWAFPAAITRSVHYLTRVPGQDSALYYAQIARDPVALKVKLADIADNSDESRLSVLDRATAARLRRKYGKAMAMLGSETGR
ncbi:phosphohydrolase [Xanthomonas euvesicatoria]